MEGGMSETVTLRDQFAMAAVTGWTTGLSWKFGRLLQEHAVAQDVYAQIARGAYQLVDAMLAERNKTRSNAETQ
jgi:hypothetical protein